MHAATGCDSAQCAPRNAKKAANSDRRRHKRAADRGRRDAAAEEFGAASPELQRFRLLNMELSKASKAEDFQDWGIIITMMEECKKTLGPAEVAVQRKLAQAWD